MIIVFWDILWLWSSILTCYWRWSLDDRECSVPWIRSWICGKSMIILPLKKDVVSMTKLSVIKIIIWKSKLTLSQIRIHNDGSVKGKLHSKPHCARVTRHSFGSWQWMVMCTQRSDLWYPVENFLNRAIRKKNWVSRWSTPTWGGISMLSYHIFELYKSKKVSSQDRLWSIMNNIHSMEYLSLPWYTSCEVERVIKIFFPFLFWNPCLFRISRTRFILRGGRFVTP